MSSGTIKVMRRRLGQAVLRLAGLIAIALLPLRAIAAEESGSATPLRSIEYDLPQSEPLLLAYLVGFILLAGFVVWLSLRDSREASPIWRVWMVLLRLGVLAGLVAIAISPQERTQKIQYRPSRVAMLVDTSLSMRFPEETLSALSSGESEPERTRADAIQDLLSDADWLRELRGRHEVSVYTFDSELHGPHNVFARQSEETAEANPPATVQDSAPSSNAETNWAELVSPRGLETRLGESLLELIRQVNGRTLAGIVVMSDGAANAGVDPATAHDVAKDANVRLITLGVGSTERPVNVQLVNIQAPTDVHVGDPYDVTAFVQGQGLAGKAIDVELLARDTDPDAVPVSIETKQVTLLEDGIPAEVTFRRNPSAAGEVELYIRAKLPDSIRELSVDDNERRKTVNAIDRETRVLLIAGGPMRDYQFVRNLLDRHSAIDVSVWLQTGSVGISQDADEVLFEFPDTREKLYSYDVIIAFDPEWDRIPADRLDMLSEWVFAQGGGLMFVAGDVYTPQLASGSDALKPVLDLYPVFLRSQMLDSPYDPQSERSAQPWPVDFTREGSDAGFLQLEDDPAVAVATWKRFPGVYRTYPTNGPKAGAMVYANFADPRSETEFGLPILLASQFYGAGRTFYLGSPEIWRLRSLGAEYYDRFWINVVRELGQGRLQRGTKRGMLLLERGEYALGQSVHVRAHLLDPQYNPYDTDAVRMSVVDPTGKPLVPDRMLIRDPNRPGQFTGEFPATRPGTYDLTLPIPESSEQLTGKVDVILPSLESDNPQQNAKLLTDLSLETGGQYLRLEDARQQLAALLPDSGEELLVDERLRTLWDREWLMYLLVGLLSMEWLTRKLLKLA